MSDIIIFGMQGSGKGTQSAILAEKHHFQIFDTGSALRKIASEESDLGHKVNSIINSGQLVPTTIVMDVLEKSIQATDPNTTFIFDGIPRSNEQLQQFEAKMKKLDRTPQALYIEISREEAENRLLKRRMCRGCGAIYGATYESDTCEKCGGEVYTRADDNPEAIKQRIDIFFKETLPIIDFYENQNRLMKINGNQNVSEVLNEIEKSLHFPTN